MSADGKIEIQLKLESDDYESALNRAKQQTDTFADKIKDTTSEGSEGFTVLKGAIANMVSEGIQRAIQAIKEFAAETIQVGSEFDTSMSDVQAKSGATASELEALRSKAKEMGSTTKFSATEAADAMGYMAMAGWKTDDMLEGITGILALAAAGNTDLATTSDIVTDALTAFGQSADEAGRLADIMAAASSNANTNVELMGETFKYVGPVAGALGYSMEDTSVAIGLMANAGIKGSQAGTSLRSIISKLVSPTKEGATAMEELGISITNADGSMKPFGEVIDILRDKMGGLSEAEQAQMAKTIAGQEAMSGLLAIVNASPEDYNKLTEAINNSSGAAEQMAATMQDNLGGDITTLKSKLEGVQISLYEQFEPALRFAVKGLQKLSDAFKWCIDNIPGFVPAVTALATALGILAGALAISTLIDMVKNAMIGLNTALLTNPIVLIVAAIAGLVVAFVMLWNKSEAFRNFWIGLWESVKDICSKTVEWIKSAWDGIITFFTSVVPEAFNAFVDGVKQKFDEFIEFFTTTIPQAISDFVEQAGIFFSETLPFAIGYGIGLIVAKFLEWGEALVTFVTVDIPAFIEGVIQWFSQLPGNIWAWLTQAIAFMAQWVSETISKGIEAGSQFLSNLIQWFSQLPGNIWSWLTQTISKAAQFVTNFAAKAKEAGNKFKTDLVNTVQQIPGQMVSIGSNIVSGIWNGISGAWGALVNNVKGLCNNLVSGFKSALNINSPSRVFRDAAMSIPEGIAVGINKGAHYALSAMNALTTNVVGAFKQSDLADRFALETGYIGAQGYYKGGNNYTVNQTINSAKELSPSEIAKDTSNAIRRLEWQ